MFQVWLPAYDARNARQDRQMQESRNFSTIRETSVKLTQNEREADAGEQA